MKKSTFIIFILTLFSCEKAIDWKFYPSENQYIVVESIITNENSNKEVKINYSAQNLNEKPQPVFGAEVIVSDGFNEYTFTEADSGIYISDNKLVAVVNRIYTLTIIIEEKTYTAVSAMVPVNDFEPISYSYTDDSSCRFSSTPSQFLPDENSMYKITIDYSNLPEYTDSSYYQTHKIVYYYSLSSIDVPEIFAPDAEKLTFPRGSIITERKYSLTPQHADFMRSMLLETSWRGGVFDVEHGNVTTNLSEGALGYFGACSVIQKSFVAE
ncbi:MAG: DUF4249 family protein [Bacteroidales bacterium]|nr:DUF4249 family protein [Bacteroidales bacterium]